jgi:hypothetical protein
MGDEAKARSRSRALSPKTTCLSIRIAPEELALLAAAAEVASMPTSSWVRYLSAAEQTRCYPLKKAVLSHRRR